MKSLKDMTLKEKLGQLVMVGFETGEYDDHIKTMVEEYKVANVILFNRNVINMPQLIKLNKELYKNILKHTGTIPFISIDQEGGMVTRIMNGAVFAPGAMTISATNDKNNAYKIGSIMGEDMIKLGINLDLAPDLDTNNNPLNPVIGVRSYGDDPKVVAEFGNEYIRGLQEQGVLATAKHFPGHGDTNVDSHLGLPTVYHDKERLQNVELVPFKSAIKRGIKAIMSAHIIFKAYDDVPATLSEKILTGLLRNELGFNGLIVSDCMQMKAIDNLYTTHKGVAMGIKAGLNIACISHTLDKQVDSLKELEQAVLNGDIPMELIDERVERVLKAKEEIEELMNKEFINKTDSELAKYFENRANEQEFAQNVCDKSLTLVRGEEIKLKGKTLVLAPVPFATTIAEDKVNPRSVVDMVNNAKIKDVTSITIETNPSDTESIVNICKDYDTIILVTYNASANRSQIDLAIAINKINKNLYIISSRNPYDGLYLNDIKNIQSLYEYTPLSVNTIVKAIKGEIKPQGKMPVSVNGNVEIGASVYVGLKDYKLEDNLKYLDFLYNKGIKKIFMSAHMPEANEEFDKEFECVLNYACNKGFQVTLDVNKNKLLEMEEKGYGNLVKTMRLDYGFTNEEILDFQYKPYFIELNASTVSDKLIKYLKDNNADFSRYQVSFNFYPKPYTGMDFEDVVKKCNYLHSNGFKVMGFMPGVVNKRPPLYLGLPTIEEQRNNNVIANVSELILAGVDYIYFSDAYITEAEIDDAKNNSRTEIRIPIIINKKVNKELREHLTSLQANRSDNNSYMVRSSKRREGIEEFNTVDMRLGDVLVDNYKNMRYQGEVCIALKDMKNSGVTNVVGKCACNEFLIKNIKGGMRFKLVIIGEE